MASAITTRRKHKGVFWVTAAALSLLTLVVGGGAAFASDFVCTWGASGCVYTQRDCPWVTRTIQSPADFGCNCLSHNAGGTIIGTHSFSILGANTSTKLKSVPANVS